MVNRNIAAIRGIGLLKGDFAQGIFGKYLINRTSSAGFSLLVLKNRRFGMGRGTDIYRIVNNILLNVSASPKQEQMFREPDPVSGGMKSGDLVVRYVDRWIDRPYGIPEISGNRFLSSVAERVLVSASTVLRNREKLESIYESLIHSRRLTAADNMLNGEFKRIFAAYPEYAGRTNLIYGRSESILMELVRRGFLNADRVKENIGQNLSASALEELKIIARSSAGGAGLFRGHASQRSAVASFEYATAHEGIIKRQDITNPSRELDEGQFSIQQGVSGLNEGRFSVWEDIGKKPDAIKELDEGRFSVQKDIGEKPDVANKGKYSGREQILLQHDTSERHNINEMNPDRGRFSVREDIREKPDVANIDNYSGREHIHVQQDISERHNISERQDTFHKLTLTGRQDILERQYITEEQSIIERKNIKRQNAIESIRDVFDIIGFGRLLEQAAVSTRLIDDISGIPSRETVESAEKLTSRLVNAISGVPDGETAETVDKLTSRLVNAISGVPDGETAETADKLTSRLVNAISGVPDGETAETTNNPVYRLINAISGIPDGIGSLKKEMRVSAYGKQWYLSLFRRLYETIEPASKSKDWLAHIYTNLIQSRRTLMTDRAVYNTLIGVFTTNFTGINDSLGVSLVYRRSENALIELVKRGLLDVRHISEEISHSLSSDAQEELRIIKQNMAMEEGWLEGQSTSQILRSDRIKHITERQYIVEKQDIVERVRNVLDTIRLEELLEQAIVSRTTPIAGKIPSSQAMGMETGKRQSTSAVNLSMPDAKRASGDSPDITDDMLDENSDRFIGLLINTISGTSIDYNKLDTDIHKYSYRRKLTDRVLNRLFESMEPVHEKQEKLAGIYSNFIISRWSAMLNKTVIEAIDRIFAAGTRTTQGVEVRIPTQLIYRRTEAILGELVRKGLVDAAYVKEKLEKSLSASAREELSGLASDTGIEQRWVPAVRKEELENNTDHNYLTKGVTREIAEKIKTTLDIIRLNSFLEHVAVTGTVQTMRNAAVADTVPTMRNTAVTETVPTLKQAEVEDIASLNEKAAITEMTLSGNRNTFMTPALRAAGIPDLSLKSLGLHDSIGAKDITGATGKTVVDVAEELIDTVIEAISTVPGSPGRHSLYLQLERTSQASRGKQWIEGIMDRLVSAANPALSGQESLIELFSRNIHGRKLLTGSMFTRLLYLVFSMDPYNLGRYIQPGTKYNGAEGMRNQLVYGRTGAIVNELVRRGLIDIRLISEEVIQGLSEDIRNELSVLKRSSASSRSILSKVAESGDAAGEISEEFNAILFDNILRQAAVSGFNQDAWENAVALISPEMPVYRNMHGIDRGRFFEPGILQTPLAKLPSEAAALPSMKAVLAGPGLIYEHAATVSKLLANRNTEARNAEARNPGSIYRMFEGTGWDSDRHLQELLRRVMTEKNKFTDRSPDETSPYESENSAPGGVNGLYKSDAAAVFRKSFDSIKLINLLGQVLSDGGISQTEYVNVDTGGIKIRIRNLAGSRTAFRQEMAAAREAADGLRPAATLESQRRRTISQKTGMIMSESVSQPEMDLILEPAGDIRNTAELGSTIRRAIVPRISMMMPEIQYRLEMGIEPEIGLRTEMDSKTVMASLAGKASKPETATSGMMIRREITPVSVITPVTGVTARPAMAFMADTIMRHAAEKGQDLPNGRAYGNIFDYPVLLNVKKVEGDTREDKKGAREENGNRVEEINRTENIRVDVPQKELSTAELSRIIEKVIYEVDKRSKFDRQRKGL